MRIDAPVQRRLLELARAAIIDSVAAGRLAHAPSNFFSPVDRASVLATHAASFVTLSIHGALRGCCGSIEPSLSLADDVWRNAQRSAFEDPRFAALRPDEAGATLLEISVLSPLERLPTLTEQTLLTTLRPGVDGLLLTWGEQRATFLPKVWQQLPEPKMFLTQLKRKLGVTDEFWDDELRLSRYTTREFGGMLKT